MTWHAFPECALNGGALYKQDVETSNFSPVKETLVTKESNHELSFPLSPPIKEFLQPLLLRQRNENIIPAPWFLAEKGNEIP